MNKQLSTLLNTLETTDIPLCISREFIPFVEEYQNNGNVHTKPLIERVNFVLELLEKVNKFIKENK
jgi:archaellum component FlaC